MIVGAGAASFSSRRSQFYNGGYQWWCHSSQVHRCTKRDIRGYRCTTGMCTTNLTVCKTCHTAFLLFFARNQTQNLFSSGHLCVCMSSVGYCVTWCSNLCLSLLSAENILLAIELLLQPSNIQIKLVTQLHTFIWIKLTSYMKMQ